MKEKGASNAKSTPGTGHNQFLRKASLIIGNSSKGIDLSALQFTFQIKQADKENPQSASIRIFNLSPDTAKKIKTDEYVRVILQAGYQTGAYGVIFDGEIVQARLGRESAVDTYMDVLAAEGYSAHQATVNTTLAAGSTVADAASAAAGTTGMQLSPYEFDPDAKLPRGQVLYGMSRDVLHRSVATTGHSYFYQNGQIVIVPLQGFKPGAAVVLNANSGMIGWPEQTQEGIRVRCLLNPLLELGGRIKIDNASILRAQTPYQDPRFVDTFPSIEDDGLYRIILMEHSGDTRGTNWYTNIVAVAFDQTKDTGISSLNQRGIF